MGRTRRLLLRFLKQAKLQISVEAAETVWQHPKMTDRRAPEISSDPQVSCAIAKTFAEACAHRTVGHRCDHERHRNATYCACHATDDGDEPDYDAT